MRPVAPIAAEALAVMDLVAVEVGVMAETDGEAVAVAVGHHWEMD